MERYRVGLILSIPEFDTYKSLQRFAEDPTRVDNRLAFNCLYKQAETRAVWRAASGFGVDKLESAVKLITGSLGEKSPASRDANILEGFMDKSEAEQLDIFNKICE